MITETQKCSNAFSWVPTPTGGKATLSWIARNFTRSIISQMRSSTSLTCAKAVAYKWSRQIDFASLGL